MRRTLVILVAVAALSATFFQHSALAQNSSAQFGDPPIAALISISDPQNGFVVVNGSVGAVFPAAQVAVQNMYTGDTVYTQAGITGSFTATLAGTSDTPYWISAAANIPQEMRERSGSLPGGPGTIVYGAGDGDPTTFSISGPVARGAGLWQASGQVSGTSFDRGDTLSVRMDFQIQSSGIPNDISTLALIGRMGFQPVSGDAELFATGGRYGNNGWSGLLTSSGVPIVNLSGDVIVSEVAVGADQITRDGQNLTFSMQVDLIIPDNMANGFYTPFFEGLVREDDGEPLPWGDNALLGVGIDEPVARLSRLPIVVRVGSADQGRMLWTLLQDTVSDGSRGIISAEDMPNHALSNRIHFDSPTFIVAPFAADGETLLTYSLEPYFLQMLSNDYQSVVPPLVPLRLPGGSVSVQVTTPDGTVQDLGSYPFMQNQLSTPLLDERLLSGASSVTDPYQLTTLRPELRQYTLPSYGEYMVHVDGYVDDIFDHRYEGGGTYTFLAAELLDLTPGVLPGTPFEVGDMFNPGIHISPGVAAEVSVHVRIYPIDGSTVIEKRFSGFANTNGVFFPARDTLSFDVAGEYVADYEARYTDDFGRLWAGSLRSAGVIATPGSTLIAHGQRGLAGDNTDLRSAWYNTLPGGQRGVRPRFPYHSGDIVWASDGAAGGLLPAIRSQDTSGAYAVWLASQNPLQRDLLNRLAVLGELPVEYMAEPVSDLLMGTAPANEGYAYISAVRPGVTARQMVLGSDDGLLPLEWNFDEPYNQQTGAGLLGDQPGDYHFLFGGIVVKNSTLNLHETAIYAALALPIDLERDVLGPRIYPPYQGEAGGPNGGNLFTFKDEPVEMFFHPTGTQPGDILFTGETLVIAGQAAPTLASKVAVTVTSPDGQVISYEGRANAIGYYYDAMQNITVEQPGVWTIAIKLIHDGQTSAGAVQIPYPEGGVLGADDFTFPVYVLPRSTQKLEWQGKQDVPIPPTLAYNALFELPEDWREIDVRFIETIPGYIVNSGTISPSGRSFTYQYNPFQIDQIIPNWESTPSAQGAAASDPVTITLIASGLDAQGERQYLYRLVTVRHDRLMTLE